MTIINKFIQFFQIKDGFGSSKESKSLICEDYDQLNTFVVISKKFIYGENYFHENRFPESSVFIELTRLN